MPATINAQPKMGQLDMRKKHSKFERAYKQHAPRPATPEPGSFKSMSAARVRMAAMACCCDPEDVTADDWAALEEYLSLDGNPAGL